jgi:dephospho-CoA kinase
VFDADAVVKDLWKDPDILNRAVLRWGRRILKEDGTADFKAIAAILFEDPNNPVENEFAGSLLHPRVTAVLKERAERAGGWCVLEIPLLFEVGVPEWVDRTVFVTAPLPLRLDRASARSWDEKELARRDAFFLPSDRRAPMADHVVCNDGSMEALKRKLERLRTHFRHEELDLLHKGLEPEMKFYLQLVGHAAASIGKRVFLVGGAARDLLLGRGTKDLDLLIEGNAIKVLHMIYSHFESRRVHGEWQFMFYKRYGTGTLIHRRTGQRLDLASTRKEVREDGGRHSLKSAGLEEDLLRRDFTVNALAYAIDHAHWGKLYDPCGGLDDLQSGLLRVLHDESFMDDPTRILRGIRFEQRIGLTFEPHTETLLHEAIEAGCFERAAPSRLKKELELCAAEPAADRIGKRFRELGIPFSPGLPLR